MPSEPWASPEGCRRVTKINLIIDYHRSDISEIKLKRTDTTLDLSQKAKRAGEERGEWGTARIYTCVECRVTDGGFGL